MLNLGAFLVAGAWLLSLYGLTTGIAGAKGKLSKLTRSSETASYLAALFILGALAYLASAFINHDYRFLYVWRYSNNTMHPAYLISSVWGGMDGSLLLWAGISSCYAALAVLRNRGTNRELMSWVTPILHLNTCFFLTVVLFLTNPFRAVDIAPQTDGNGLNPLLQNPSMLIHPPSLYLGFTGFSVPFAFALGALFSGRLDARWTELARRWSLVAWGFLTLGIVLGGNWAYIVLGWGGFWGWDPVENASFLPWLAGTAYIHSVMVEERRGMFKTWNIVLCVLSYLLAVFGTFLTRSGVVQSVHAFAESDVGWVFLVYLGCVAAVTLVALISRRHLLAGEHRLESYLSRESAVLLGSLIFLGICFATFWGTLFPVISEALFSEKNVVGPPFFNRVNGPLFTALLFLMGIGPLIAWRGTSAKVLAKIFILPFSLGTAVALAALYFAPQNVVPALAFGACAFVLAGIAGEYRRALRVRRELTGEGLLIGATGLIHTKPRRYGGLLVHIGVVVMAVSIVASMSYKIERDLVLKVGQKVEIGRYAIQLKDLQSAKAPNYTALVARLGVMDMRSGAILRDVVPERRYYPASEEFNSIVDIRMRPIEDLYIALAGLDEESQAKGDLKSASVILKIYINPLQIWLWAGAALVLLGTLVVIGPRFKVSTVTASEQAGLEIQRP